MTPKNKVFEGVDISLSLHQAITKEFLFIGTLFEKRATQIDLAFVRLNNCGARSLSNHADDVSI